MGPQGLEIRNNYHHTQKMVIKWTENFWLITLLNTVYEIWATIIPNGLTPITNLITNDNQCAYKTKDQQRTQSDIAKANLLRMKYKDAYHLTYHMHLVELIETNYVG